MATRKQIFLPLVVILAAGAGLIGLMALQEPMEEKPVVEFSPRVKAQLLETKSLVLDVQSQGLVEPTEKTMLVAQVSGQVVSIAKNFVKGEFVKKGTVLLKIDASDYQANLVEAQANLASAQAQLQQEKARGHVALSEWEKINDSTPSQLGLRKPQLAQEQARVRAAQALVNKAQRSLDRTTIKAPYDAIVNSRSVSLGSVLNMGSTIGLVSATRVAQVRLPVADKDLAFLNNDGVGAEVELTSSFNGKLTQWQGHVVRNEGVIDSTSRMHYLVVEVPSPYEQAKPLRFGSYATAKVAGHQIDNVALVPRHLIHDNKIALVSKQSTLNLTPVTVIRDQGSEVVIAGEFDSNSRYVTTALSYPIEGMTLSLADSEAKEAP